MFKVNNKDTRTAPMASKTDISSIKNLLLMTYPRKDFNAVSTLIVFRDVTQHQINVETMLFTSKLNLSRLSKVAYFNVNISNVAILNVEFHNVDQR